MPEEEHKEEHHGLAHGHHAEHQDKSNATYWALGLSAVGVLLAVLVLSGGGSKKSQSQKSYELVHQSQDFIPNPTDVSIGSNAAPLYWPALPTSGTPTQPKMHHVGEHESHAIKQKKTVKHHTTAPNDHKGYGKSPRGASHGHAVTTHSHNPVVQHVKGKANG